MKFLTILDLGSAILVHSCSDGDETIGRSRAHREPNSNLMSLILNSKDKFFRMSHGAAANKFDLRLNLLRYNHSSGEFDPTYLQAA